ncbi:MAG: hypothetical protein HY042_01890 [Spirochaetia bacterium]|nr:hypothetical protein [Spirochaetia bacterium]
MSAPVIGQTRDARGDATVNVWSRYAEVALDFDRTMYRVGEDIPVRFRVSNTGTQVIRVYPSNDPARTFQFMVTDKTGREIPMQFDKPRFQKRENGDKTVVSLQGDRSKEIILHPGETFEKRVFLNDFYRLPPGSEYRITGYYYPDARQNMFVRSRNTARLFVERPRQPPQIRGAPQVYHSL